MEKYQKLVIKLKLRLDYEVKVKNLNFNLKKSEIDLIKDNSPIRSPNINSNKNNKN